MCGDILECFPTRGDVLVFLPNRGDGLEHKYHTKNLKEKKIKIVTEIMTSKISKALIVLQIITEIMTLKK